MSSNKTTPRGRDAKSGQFIPVREAQRRPSTTVVERIPVRSSAPKRKGGR